MWVSPPGTVGTVGCRSSLLGRPARVPAALTRGARAVRLDDAVDDTLPPSAASRTVSEAPRIGCTPCWLQALTKRAAP